MIRADFDRQMTRLLGLRFAPVDLVTHWEGLRDLPAEALERAVSRAQTTRIDFPTPAELRQDADLSRVRETEPSEDRAMVLELPFEVVVPGAGTVVSVTREWRYYDERCADTGWASWWCGEASHVRRAPWSEAQPCERRGDHEAHEWVGQCACWASNPALVRKREAQRAYAEAPVDNRKRGHK